MTETATGRAEILAKIRQARERRAGGGAPGDVDTRLREHPANLVPQRGQLDRPARLALFAKEAEKVDATVVRVGQRSAVPAEVARYLKAANLSTRIKVAPSLAGLAWQGTLLEVDSGPCQATDAVSVTQAVAGVAETGTLVACSGPEDPTTLNFLPPTNIMVVAAADMVGSYEEVWQRLRGDAPAGGAFMPRTVNFITGPSRSADIEQTLLLGAHGPQRLHIIVVEDETTEE